MKLDPDDFMKQIDPPPNHSDYGFALVCWSMVLGPIIIVIATGNWWYLLLYTITALVFGLA